MIRKRGTTCVGLSLKLGLTRNAVSQALARPWPRVERAIADFLDEKPERLWPKRYDRRGESLRRSPGRPRKNA